MILTSLDIQKEAEKLYNSDNYSALDLWQNEKWVHYRYKEAFNLLMEYWNCLPDEDKPKIDKKLKELGV